MGGAPRVKEEALGMASPTLEECKAFLQKPAVDGNGATMFGHVSEILLKLVEERPANPVDVFEEVSAAVKQSSYSASDAPLRRSYQDHPSIQWARNTVEQFRIKGPGEDKAAGGDAGCEIQNITQDAQMFEAAGIGIGSHQAACLAVGLRKLAEIEPLKSVRFWGKITGTKRDYIIAEATYTDPKAHEPAPHDEPEEVKPGAAEPVPPEKMGEGLNSYVYYVVGYEYAPDGVYGRYTYDKWVKLPPVKPEHIMAARAIRKMFTGELDAPVDSYPPFPGSEAEYLGAQVARISRGCTMTVAGAWSAEPDENDQLVIAQKPLTGDDPFAPVKSTELVNPETYLESWVHHPMYPSILSKMGRCVYPKKVLAEDEEPPEEEEWMQGEAPNKSITEEQPVGAIAAFSVRLATPVLGDYSAAVLRSNRWPGAYAAVLENQMVNVYVGDGLKYTGQSFQVAMPPALPQECSEEVIPEDGGEEDKTVRPGMREQVDVRMPDSFLDVDGTAEADPDAEDA